MYIIMLFYI